MYRQRAPTMVFAVVFAIVAGTLFATGEWIGGAVLSALALGCAAADFFDKSDSSGLY